MFSDSQNTYAKKAENNIAKKKMQKKAEMQKKQVGCIYFFDKTFIIFLKN